MIILVILVYGFLAYIQLVPLYKNKQWRDFWVNSFISALSFLIAASLSFSIKVPSPAEPIKNFITAFFGK
jgi:hypothetical protein